MISSIGKPINSFFSWYLETRILEIETFIYDPFSIQEKTLTTLLNKELVGTPLIAAIRRIANTSFS